MAMQALRKCFQNAVASYTKTNINNIALSKSLIHTTLAPIDDDDAPTKPRRWPTYNRVIYPPQEPGEPRRPAFINHVKTNIKYSPKNMWYIAVLVRGMSVDEAIKQLSFCGKKGALAAKETILEAQEMAVRDHNVEFKSNLWVSESFCSKALTIKGLRRHAKGRRGIVHYRYVHYFVRLEEGKPPTHYYLPEPKNKDELLETWLQKYRQRKISNSL